MSNANPAVSRESAKYFADQKRDVDTLKQEVALLKQQLANTNRQQVSNSVLLGDRGFKTEPAVFAESDSDGFLVNVSYSNPVQYTNAAIPIPVGFNRALINMTGSLSAINTGVGSAAITLICEPFYNIDPLADPADKVTLPYRGLCATPLSGSGTAVSATSADVSVVEPGSGGTLYVGLLSYFDGPTAGNILTAEIRLSGSVVFYKG